MADKPELNESLGEIRAEALSSEAALATPLSAPSAPALENADEPGSAEDWNVLGVSSVAIEWKADGLAERARPASCCCYSRRQARARCVRKSDGHRKGERRACKKQSMSAPFVSIEALAKAHTPPEES